MPNNSDIRFIYRVRPASSLIGYLIAAAAFIVLGRDQIDAVGEQRLLGDEHVEHGARTDFLLLLDPLVRLHGIDENNAGEVAELLAYFRWLQRELDLSVLLVHHTRKNAAVGVAAGVGLRGSSDLHAFGDSNLYLRRTKDRLLLSSEHRAAPASPGSPTSSPRWATATSPGRTAILSP
jgi:hypothetical protein